MTTAAYVRVSSRAQTHATQRDAIERVARARGDTIQVWYSEKFSAKTLDRAVLAKLRADARAGRISKLYVYRLDRLARSGIRDMFEVVEQLREHGVEVVTVADGFDLTGPAAEVVLAVIAWAAKMERLAINERISAARERLRVEGRAWGRPPRLRPREVERARSLAAQGLSVRAVAAHLNAPRATVHRALSHKVAAPSTT
jgi:DNA invertase Pin-like site-specific DNA recombinase